MHGTFEIDVLSFGFEVKKPNTNGEKRGLCTEKRGTWKPFCEFLAVVRKDDVSLFADTLCQSVLSSLLVTIRKKGASP